MFEIPNFFKQTKKELPPKERESKEIFESTGIVEKLEKIRDSKNLKYSEKELAHIEYNQNKIEFIFDYEKYEYRFGPVEKLKKISIIKNGSYFQFNYFDSREENNNIEFISNKPVEILEKIGEVVKINYERK